MKKQEIRKSINSSGYKVCKIVPYQWFDLNTKKTMTSKEVLFRVFITPYKRLLKKERACNLMTQAKVWADGRITFINTF